jgi:hypothetical protein
MGPALSNLDGLLAMPYGCGEQNMAKFAPNIYIMDYLTNTDQASRKTKDDAIYYMNSGWCIFRNRDLTILGRQRDGDGQNKLLQINSSKGSSSYIINRMHLIQF